jgi:hypothetical protein
MVCAPVAALSVLAAAAAQASAHEGPVDPVNGALGQGAGPGTAVGKAVRRPAITPCGSAGRPGAAIGERPHGLSDRLGHVADLLRGGPAGSPPAGGLDRVTGDAACRLPMNPGAVPAEPLRAAGTMKDALPAGLGDTELPGPLAGGSPQTGGPSAVSGGPSGMFGGLPGLGGAMPGTTLRRLPMTPALG